MAINAHTHIYSGLAPLGMPAPEEEPRCFIEILERVWWRLDRALDRDSLEASARYYVAESVLAGCTGLIDHHESPNLIEGSLDIIADACDELGMPAVLCYGVTERNGGREEARRGLDECRRFIRDNRRPRVRGVVGIHASFTVGDQTIADAAALARELSTVLHVHVAEDQADVTDARTRGYHGIIDRFARLDALIPGSIFAHGVHLTRDEVERVDGAGIWLVQNPRSNHGNGVGHPRHLDASTRVALGTDGYPANMSDELHALQTLAPMGEDAPSVARARLEGSQRLFSRFFAHTSLAPGDAVCQVTPKLGHLREEARLQARALWARMKAL